MRRRLLLSALLGSLPLIVLGVLLFLGNYRYTRERILSENLYTARLVATYVQGWLEGEMRILATLNASNEVLSGRQASLQGLIERQSRANPEWNILFVTDASGKIIASSIPTTASVSDREYFRTARRTGRPTVSNFLVGRVSGRRTIALAYPIMREEGRFQGVIVAGIRPQTIQQLFNKVRVRRDETIALWGKNGRLIARTDTAESMLGTIYHGRNASVILSGRSGAIISTSPINGERVLVGYAPVRMSPWIVINSTPYALATAPLTRILLTFLLMSFLVVTLTLLWSFYSANTVSQQIADLAQGARAIGEGTLATRVAMHGIRELDDLALSLNKMAADLAVVERLKSDLLGMVSHELKTPLTSIQTSLDLVTSGLITPADPRFAEMLEIAERQSRRLQGMIENLLSVARTEEGTLAVTLKPVALRAIIQPAVDLYDEAARERGLTLTVDAPDDVRVLADAQKITLVLNNLLDNAVKFTEAGGITLRAAVQGREVVITVTDTGIGLTDDVRRHLFERFYQAEPLLTRKAGGAGLGLFVVKTVVDAHGGRVFAESPGPGAGSTFGFTLPLAGPVAPDRVQ